MQWNLISLYFIPILKSQEINNTIKTPKFCRTFKVNITIENQYDIETMIKLKVAAL